MPKMNQLDYLADIIFEHAEGLLGPEEPDRIACKRLAADLLNSIRTYTPVKTESLLSRELGDFGHEILPWVLGWIRDNLSPDQVFTEQNLMLWFTDSKHQLLRSYDLDKLIDSDSLHTWAQKYGYFLKD